MDDSIQSNRSSTTLRTSSKGEIHFDIKIYWSEEDTPESVVSRIQQVYTLMNTTFPNNIVKKTNH